MKRSFGWPILSGALIIAVALSLISAAQPAGASLGNTGIPSRCSNLGFLNPNADTFAYCTMANGTPFDAQQRVPAGYYFLVTDITVWPAAYAAVPSPMDIMICDVIDMDATYACLDMRDTSQGQTISQHYNIPYLVLSAGHRLKISSSSASYTSVTIRFSGLLVTNLNYLAWVSR